ncbi:MAG: hypothetical protein LBN41_01640 [Enterobacteriaceae bacterium]|jgi:hypothetical protein|nr:hypothetical protein [Enterobacteriaceae bacterium]
MTLNKKFWLRWISIILICIGYYLVLFYFDFIFALNFTSTMSQGGGEISSSACYSVIKHLAVDHSHAMTASYFGFILCVLLILLVFKKIR